MKKMFIVLLVAFFVFAMSSESFAQSRGGNRGISNRRIHNTQGRVHSNYVQGGTHNIRGGIHSTWRVGRGVIPGQTGHRMVGHRQVINGPIGRGVGHRTIGIGMVSPRFGPVSPRWIGSRWGWNDYPYYDYYPYWYNIGAPIVIFGGLAVAEAVINAPSYGNCTKEIRYGHWETDYSGREFWVTTRVEYEPIPCY